MADKKKLSLAIDSLKLGTDMSEKDGILSVPATLARQMVYDYDGLKVLKPFIELEAAAQFADGIPITRSHPAVGIVTDRAEVLGILRDVEAKDGDLSGTLNVKDESLKSDIKAKKITDVSCGFFCNLEETSGELDGVAYDAIQKDIFMDHVAIVDEGRCSLRDGCGLNTDARNIDSPPDLIGKIDTAIGMASSEWGNGALKDLLVEIKEMIMVNGTNDAATDLEKLKAELDATKADLTKMTEERDTIRDEAEKIVQVEKDAIIAELTAAQDTKTKADLEKLKLDELKTELAMVAELRTGRLGYKQDDTGRAAIDKAYAGEAS